MCDSGQPCENWKDPQDMLRKLGEVIPLTRVLQRLEEKHGSAAVQKAYDDLFWQVIQVRYVTVANRYGVRWVPRDEHDEHDETEEEG